VNSRPDTLTRHSRLPRNLRFLIYLDSMFRGLHNYAASGDAATLSNLVYGTDIIGPWVPKCWQRGSVEFQLPDLPGAALSMESRCWAGWDAWMVRVAGGAGEA